jgi:hypothetical protein
MNLAALSVDLCSVLKPLCEFGHEAPEKTMHRAEHRVEDIAIKAGKAHCLLVDTVSLLPLDAVAILVW